MKIILAASLAFSPIAIDSSAMDSSLDQAYIGGQAIHSDDLFLTDSERDRIYRECQFAVQKMCRAMENADYEASQITNINVRNATVGAIEGAIFGLQSCNVYKMVISSCLGAIARISGDSYTHFSRSRDYVKEAERYAGHADRLQERLWRDE